MNERLNKKLNILKNENDILKQENTAFFEKIKKLSEKNFFIKNEYQKLQKDMKKYDNINNELNMKIKDKEKKIIQLKKESNIIQSKSCFCQKK